MNGQVEWVVAGVLLAWTLAALTVIVRRGWARSDSLDDAPRRRVDLLPVDVVVGVGLLLVGRLSAIEVGQAIGLLPLPDPAPPHDLALMALLAQLVGLGPAVIYFLVRCALAGGWDQAGLWPGKPVRLLRLAALATVVALPVVFAAGLLTQWISLIVGQPVPQVAHEMLKVMLAAESRGTVALLCVSAIVVAPLLEEVIFRGLVQTSLLSVMGRWPVVGVSAVFFAVMHLPAVGVWQAMPPLLVLGLILGWLYEKTGSLWPGIALHAAFNAANVAMLLLLVPVE
ncbi:MAG: CPBP family intramembrane glutamic endopeptidase [Phycisphaeraceae bacterium]